MGVLRVRDIAGWLEDAYPSALAEDWDRVGLSVGDPDAQVDAVVLSVDVTDAVLAEAKRVGAQLIVSHHPLLLRGVHAVRADDPKGRLLIEAIRSGIAVVSAHTNADSAADGVADALADAVGMAPRRPMLPHGSPDSTAGLGRVGRLSEPLTAAALAQRLAAAVPATVTGVRLGGDPNRRIETVAVLGGAGDSLLEVARELEVDCYVTGDLRHHRAQDFLAYADAPCLIDVPHWAAEWLWLPHAEALLQSRAKDAGRPLQTRVSTLVTDPWTGIFGSHPALLSPRGTAHAARAEGGPRA